MTTRGQVTASIRAARANGGVECERVPSGPHEAFGAAVVAALVWLLPEFLYRPLVRWLAARGLVKVDNC